MKEKKSLNTDFNKLIKTLGKESNELSIRELYILFCKFGMKIEMENEELVICLKGKE